MTDDIYARMRTLSDEGRALRANLPQIAPNPLDVLAALGPAPGDETNTLASLLHHYEHARSRLPIHHGDRVRVRRQYWHLGRSGGWQGYDALFADSAARVLDVSWNRYHESWGALVRYKRPYRWIEYKKDFNIEDRPTLFWFNIDALKKVR